MKIRRGFLPFSLFCTCRWIGRGFDLVTFCPKRGGARRSIGRINEGFLPSVFFFFFAFSFPMRFPRSFLRFSFKFCCPICLGRRRGAVLIGKRLKRELSRKRFRKADDEERKTEWQEEWLSFFFAFVFAVAGMVVQVLTMASSHLNPLLASRNSSGQERRRESNQEKLECVFVLKKKR